jgi:hypothetical protein
MTEDLIGFETAKLAKEKGFNWNCNNYTSKRDGNYFSSTNVLIGYKNWNEIHETWSIPTQALLQKWLREVHDIFVSINTTSEFRWLSDDEGDQEYLPVHQFRVIKNKDNYKYDVIDWSSKYDIYEEALEIGLQEALKLIK